MDAIGAVNSEGLVVLETFSHQIQLLAAIIHVNLTREGCARFVRRTDVVCWCVRRLEVTTLCAAFGA
jgi:hypothetical protein